jgi:hypothetical protein
LFAAAHNVTIVPHPHPWTDGLEAQWEIEEWLRGRFDPKITCFILFLYLGTVWKIMNHRIWVLFSGHKKLLPKKAKRYCLFLQIIIQFYPSLALFRIIYVVFDPKSDRNGMSWDYLQLVDMIWGVRVPCFLFDF